MDTRSSLARISIRCNRVTPQCDKCEAVGAHCIFSARKPRSKKKEPEISEKSVLLEVLKRLKRLEEHCGLEGTPNTRAQDNGDGDDLMSISSSVESDDDQNVPLVESGDAPNIPVTDTSIPVTLVPAVVRSIVGRIKDEGSRSMLLSSVFCHLRSVESCFFENEQCIRAITSAMSEIEFMQSTQAIEPLRDPVVPKDQAKKLIENYYGCYQFEGFKIPLEKSFLYSIPDLIEIPHVKLDYTVQIIYYTVLLQGIIMDPEAYPGRGGIIRNLYLRCVALSDGWLANIQDTADDLFAAFLMISMALEGCNMDLSWKAFSQACRISKALGYFAVDETPSESSNHSEQPQQPHLTAPTPAPESAPASESEHHKAEVDKNRKRFEFWHILRIDCLFRMSFGKPTLMPAGSWKVNFPDPTINGVDDESSRFVQIHFIASMRLALIVMKYLDWVDCGTDPNPISHDATIDSFINEVQSILSDWDTEGLLQMATNHVDIWFCVDILFSSYKMLIVLYQSKKCNRSHILPRHAVDIARKSVTKFQALLGASLHAFWGISLWKWETSPLPSKAGVDYLHFGLCVTNDLLPLVSLILLHQFIPFFILCLDIIGNPDHDHLDADLASVTWISEYVEIVVEERVELRPILIIMKAVVTACHQTKMDRLSRSVTETV
ncbi:hypothetical protein N7481_009144 [Penicillium waksmanii]|uniref:uncharacterized protein n=1 Tax=Penicillium waksmanii TaxID=69791 RepID=UPI002548093D|nr:uncharacterized protein N7481_009144 [Penicillium waksmanii]KAJ5975437.1 hypothetical protein N7481_009144 [Penicillium waksmanii]